MRVDSDSEAKEVGVLVGGVDVTLMDNTYSSSVSFLVYSLIISMMQNANNTVVTIMPIAHPCFVPSLDTVQITTNRTMCVIIITKDQTTKSNK
jgi:hypothetical protein